MPGVAHLHESFIHVQIAELDRCERSTVAVLFRSDQLDFLALDQVSEEFLRLQAPWLFDFRGVDVEKPNLAAIIEVNGVPVDDSGTLGGICGSNQQNQNDRKFAQDLGLPPQKTRDLCDRHRLINGSVGRRVDQLLAIGL